MPKMKNEVEKDFDFRNLKFKGYHLEDDVATSERNVWFVRDNNEDDSIHVYQPELVSIENINPSYIVVIEVLRDCEHYKTMILDAKTWIANLENLSVEQNMQNFSKYVFKNILID